MEESHGIGSLFSFERIDLWEQTWSFLLIANNSFARELFKSSVQNKLIFYLYQLTFNKINTEHDTSSTFIKAY